MRTVKRPRRYVAPRWIAVGKPVFRFSQPRDAYVLRVVGRKWGPVLRPDRRRPNAVDSAPERAAARASERRGSHARAA
jgi:hypothetical protein